MFALLLLLQVAHSSGRLWAYGGVTCLRGGHRQPLRSEAVEEIEALKSIFEDEMTSVEQEDSLLCRIIIAGREHAAPLTLQIACNSRYPDEVPGIEIQGSSELARSLTVELLREAQQQRGNPMIFHLAR